MNWFELETPETLWLIDGLITTDGYASVVGKPKAGKSTFIRSLVISLIKNQPFLNRKMCVPQGTGRVLYIHLDRKDKPHRVATEFKRLGCTKQESERLFLSTEADIADKPKFETRLQWLQNKVKEHKPHLVVIDLMWQFVQAENSNAYDQVLKGINRLQDTLTEVQYQGALLVALHGRKATNDNERFDDILGSTGQRGSFSTNIMLTHHRKEQIYTIMTDQTERNDVHGEIDETILTRGPNGQLTLSVSLATLKQEERKVKAVVADRKLFEFLTEHPASTIDEITNALHITKKTALELVGNKDVVTQEGDGKKGSPYRFSLQLPVEPETESPLMSVVSTEIM
jgi:hypothetical protein